MRLFMFKRRGLRAINVFTVHYSVVQASTWITRFTLLREGVAYPFSTSRLRSYLGRFRWVGARAVRKAEHRGVVVRPLNGSDGLAEFHRLHVALRKRKYHLLAQPFEFFEAIVAKGERTSWVRRLSVLCG